MTKYYVQFKHSPYKKSDMIQNKCTIHKNIHISVNALPTTFRIAATVPTTFGYGVDDHCTTLLMTGTIACSS